MKLKPMKWHKVDQATGERMTRSGGSSLEPHDYVCYEEKFKIMNRSAEIRKGGWILVTFGGTELGRFDTLRSAKAMAEDLRH